MLEKRATKNTWWGLIFTNTHTHTHINVHKNKNTYVMSWHTHMHTDLPPLSCGKSSRCKLWPWLGCRGQKVCFSRFTPYYLFMKQRGRDGESQKGREMERNPPAWGLWCGKQNLLFNLPSNGIHMTHPDLVRFVCQFFSVLSFSVYLFAFACVVHAHMVFVMSTRVQDRTRMR